jgi:hypothetical protein
LYYAILKIDLIIYLVESIKMGDIKVTTSDIVDEDGVVVGKAYDSNPVVFSNDVECLEILQNLSKMDLDEEERDLISRCCNIMLGVGEDEEIEYTSFDALTFGELSEKFPDKAYEIIACSTYMLRYIEFDGTAPGSVYLATFNSFSTYLDNVKFK